MTGKTKIKIIEVLLLILIVITTFTIGDTYSKYKEQLDTYYRVDMKKWYIEINEKDVYAANSLTEVIEPVFVDSDYANSEILVPGREVYFDMDVDYSGIDIKFKSTFKIEQLNTNQLTDFKIYKYELDGVTTTVSNISTISTEIDPTLDTSKTTTNLKVYMKWNDESNNTMDNLEDTQFRGETVDGSDNTKLRFKITATFEQI